MAKSSFFENSTQYVDSVDTTQTVADAQAARDAAQSALAQAQAILAQCQTVEGQVANIAAVFPTRDAAIAGNIPSTVVYVLTQGLHDVNDGGGFLYRKGTGSAFTWTSNTGFTFEPVTTRKVSVEVWDAKGDGVTDDTTLLAAGYAEFSRIVWPAKTYKITNKLTCRSSQSTELSAGTVIRQYGTEKQIFTATGASHVFIAGNGAELYGLGSDYMGNGTTYPTWTGLDHPADGVEFVNCNNCGVRDLHIINCAQAGIALLGNNTSITIANVRIEGTHAWGTTLTYNVSNFQVGIYIRDDNVTYGGVNNNIKILNVEISGTVHGILVEVGASTLDTAHRNITILGIIIHDIPAQHGFYLQGGGVTIVAARLYNIALDGCKLQSAAGPPLSGPSTLIANVSVDMVASYVGDAGFVCNSMGDASVLQNIKFSGIIENTAVGTILNTDTKSGLIKDVKINVQVYTASDSAVKVQGTNAAAAPTIKDCEIDCYVENCQLDGVNVNVVGGTVTGLRIRPRVRQVNGVIGSHYGIFVNVPSGSVVELLDPDAQDSGNHQLSGLYVVSGEVRVRGSATFLNCQNVAVRIDAGGSITEWPEAARLSGVNGDFSGLNYVRSSGAIRTRATTASSTPVALWQQDLPDNTAATFIAEVVARTDDGTTARKSVQARCLAHRTSGGAVVIDGSTVLVSGTDLPTGAWSSGAALAWALSGNTLFLNCNAGGTGAYHLTARTVGVYAPIP